MAPLLLPFCKKRNKGIINASELRGKRFVRIPELIQQGVRHEIR